MGRLAPFHCTVSLSTVTPWTTPSVILKVLCVSKPACGTPRRQRLPQWLVTLLEEQSEWPDVTSFICFILSFIWLTHSSPSRTHDHIYSSRLCPPSPTPSHIHFCLCVSASLLSHLSVPSVRSISSLFAPLFLSGFLYLLLCSHVSSPCMTHSAQ